MELLLSISVMILISLIFILLFHFLFTDKSSNNKTTNSDETKASLLPGRKGLPWIGESLEFLSCLKSGNPEKFILERMEKYSSRVFRTCLIGDTFVVMCGSEASKLLLFNDNRLVRSWWPKSIDKIFSSSLQESFKLKNLAASFVKPGGLKKYVQIMDYIARKHLHDEWEGRHQVTVLPLAKKYTFTLACKLFLSIEDPEVVAKLEAPTSLLVSGMFSLPIDLPGTPLNRALKAAREMKELLAQIASKRRMQLFGPHHQTPIAHHTKDDLLTHLLLTTYDNGKRMTDMDIADRITGILVAAHDTASTVITLTFKYLAHHPRLYDAVFEENTKVAAKKGQGEFLCWEDIQELKYTWNVIREVMRLHPPAQGLLREAVTDFTYAGYRIPKGSKLFLSVNLTHKDQATFQEPEKFDPLRFDVKEPGNYAYIPFGGGANMCPGRNYAQLEILVFIHNVVKRVRWEMIEGDEKIIAYPTPKPVKGLPVRLYPHEL